MKVLDLRVRRFGCVKSAHVTLSPGLNVLHGPNDLGKSTLVNALRAALLLPPTSSACESFLSWHTKEPPEVTVVFATEPGRFHRVTKVFGQGAKAFLEYGKDDRDFATDARGRQVEEKLRTLLRWGVPSPGGRGGQKGWPESFLSSVFLAGQPEVEAILRTSLDKDRDDSGKLRITTALQALAEDKLFKVVLQRTMEKVNKAYSTRGKRFGKDSEWTKIRDRINEVQQQVEGWEKQSERAEAARLQVAELEEARDACEVLYRQKQQEVRDLEARLEGRREAEQVQARLLAAKEQLAILEATVESAREARGRAQRLEAEVEAAQSDLRAVMLEVEASEQAHALAVDRVRQVQSEDKARERELRRGKLENRSLELAAQAEALLRKKAWAERARDAQQRVDRAEATLRERQEALLALEAEERKARSAMEEVEGLARDLELAKRLGQLRQVQAQLAQARQHAMEAQALERKAQEKRAEATALSEAISSRGLPQSSVVEGLRFLRGELDVAQARLEVGLSVQVVPSSPPLSVKFSLDGGGTAGLNLSGPAEFPAAREVRLSVGDVAEVVVRAGQQSDREAVDALRVRWQEQAVPVLEASGAEDIAALEALCREQSQRRSELADREREIAKVVSEAGVKAALANRLEELEGLERAQRSELGELDESRLEALSKLEGGGLEREAGRVGKAREKALRALEGVLAKVGATRGEVEREKTQREMLVRARDEVFGEQEGAFSDVLSRVSEALEEILLQQRDVQEALGSLGQLQTAQVDEAKAQELLAIAAREQAKALQKARQEALSLARAARDQHLGALALLERQAGDADVAGALAEVQRFEGEVSLAMQGLGEVTEEQLDQARARLGEAETAWQHKQSELHTAKGA